MTTPFLFLLLESQVNPQHFTVFCKISIKKLAPTTQKSTMKLIISVSKELLHPQAKCVIGHVSYSFKCQPE